MSRFISLEGVEGAGKSTAMRAIQAFLTQHKLDYVLTREPGGTPVAEAIRHVLLSEHDEHMSRDTELLLMFATRAQNIANVIQPALQHNQWVVSDRFTDASFAYQGGGRGISLDRIEALAEWVQGDLWPDMTLLLDVPVELGLARMSNRGEKDRIEQEDVAFFERVRDTYLTCAKKYPDRYRVIDATQSIAHVAASIHQALEELL